MKPLGILVIAYIAGLIAFFIKDYLNKEERKAKENHNNEKVEE